jgi:hypothetical protein
MGLIEQIQSGSIFTKKTVGLSSTAPKTLGATYMGASYILLNISATEPCRVRLYGNSSSIAVDDVRPSSSFDYSASVVLNLDTGLTPGTQSIEFIPPIIASTHLDLNQTWYNIENSTNTNVSIQYYPIELNTSSRDFINVPAYPGISLAAYEKSFGNITSPKSFLIIGSYSENQDIRLRLYSRPIDQVPNYEKDRAFITSSATGSSLICDLLFDSASYLYKVTPVLQAYNLESYETGNNRVGYILENLSGSPQSGVYASVQIYPLED